MNIRLRTLFEFRSAAFRSAALRSAAPALAASQLRAILPHASGDPHMSRLLNGLAEEEKRVTTITSPGRPAPLTIAHIVKHDLIGGIGYYFRQLRLKAPL